MQAKKRKLKDGHEYDPLFPAADLQTKTESADADTERDTIPALEPWIRKNQWQTAKFADFVRGLKLSPADLQRFLYDFVYQHIQYQVDDNEDEEVRSPARTWHDRRGDCDCYAVLLSTILLNLGLEHNLRIADYGSGWQHIYVIVPDPAAPRRKDGSHYWVLDPVMEAWNAEAPYQRVFDIPMKLNFLSGIPGLTSNQTSQPMNNYHNLGCRCGGYSQMNGFPIPNLLGLGAGALSPAASSDEIYKATLNVWNRSTPEWILNDGQTGKTTAQKVTEYAQYYAGNADFVSKVNSGEFADIAAEVLSLRAAGSGGGGTSMTPPNPQNPQNPPAPAQKGLKAWWNKRSTGEKWAIGIGSAVVVGLLIAWAAGAFDKKKPAPKRPEMSGGKLNGTADKGHKKGKKKKWKMPKGVIRDHHTGQFRKVA